MATFLIVLFLMVCVLLICVVLLQKGRGGGLGSAFGAGAGSSAFGTRTGDVFTWVTIILTAVFLLLAATCAIAIRPPSQQVQSPVLDPPAWPLGADGTVSMSCYGTKGAVIRYTVNANEPSEKSTLYRVPIRVHEGDLVQARAFRAGLDPSELVSVKYEKPASQVSSEPTTKPAATKPVEVKPAEVKPPTQTPAPTTK